MTTRTLLIAAVAAFAVMPIAAQAETPLQKETSVWQAFKDKKAEKVKGLVGPEFVAMYADGVFSRDSELTSMKATNIASFKISNFTHKVIDPENVLMTYTADVKGKKGKEDISGTYRAASVWHRSGKLWRAVFHTEVKAK